MKVVVALAIALGLVSSLTMFASAEPKSSKLRYVMAYNVADLPVWRTNGKETKFAPQVLIKYLQSTVDPQSWENGAAVKADEKRASLIIAQTQANHEAIGAAMKSFRDSDVR